MFSDVPVLGINSYIVGCKFDFYWTCKARIEELIVT